ncbi:hypothetical protein E2320_022655 [Naja naja]|nr:hypothetical protein E2320_022655 [Naja naja]
MTAECESPVALHRHFIVTYTLINNLDFLAMRLVWTPESAVAGKKLNACDKCHATPEPQDSIVCHTPLNVGFSHKGSARTLCHLPGSACWLLSQHMKLKLQFTASVSNLPPEVRPVSHKSSPGSPAVRELVGHHQASLGRSHSFSHQQPTRGHRLRSGSVMERRAITPPVGSPVGRPLYLPPDKAALSLDKIAKWECKVLVLAPPSLRTRPELHRMDPPTCPALPLLTRPPQPHLLKWDCSAAPLAGSLSWLCHSSLFQGLLPLSPTHPLSSSS